MPPDIVANLVMFTGDGTRRQFPLSKDRVVIGRTNACDLRIPLSSVSRKHCELVLHDRIVKLRDLGSSNGTYRNGVRVQEVDLEAGDQIEIGPIVFTLEVDGKPSQIKPMRSKVQSASAVVPSSGNADESAVGDPLDLAIADLEGICDADAGDSGQASKVADQGSQGKNP